MFWTIRQVLRYIDMLPKYTLNLWNVYLAEMLKRASKRARIFAPEPGHCGDNKHRRLAVLVVLIVKLSPWANTPWGGKGPPCQSLGGEGAAKAWYCPLVLPWRVSALVMSNLMFEAHWPMKALPSRTCSAGRGESQGVMWPWTLCLELKHPLSCRALRQLECMAKSRSRECLFGGLECFVANQQPRRESL